MTLDARDAQPMSVADRKAEIAALFAAAYVRLLARRNGLALDGDGEPSCAAVDGGERRGRLAPTTRKEVS